MSTITTTPVSAPPIQGGIARWSRLASLGLALAGVAPLLMLGAGLLWGMDVGDSVAIFLIVAVIGLGGAAAVRRPRTPWKVVGVVAPVLVAMALFWTAFGLARPNSFFDFVPGTMVVPGALVALVAGIAGLRAQRRGDLTDVAVGGERRGIRIVAGVVGALAVVSAIASIAGRETVSSAQAATASARVNLKDFKYDRTGYSAAAGSAVLVKNSDPFAHTFTVDALGIDVTLTPGSEKLVKIPAQPGVYIVYCKPHTGNKTKPSKDDMASKLTVG